MPGLVPVAVTTSAQVAMSLAMKAPNSAGVIGAARVARSSTGRSTAGSRIRATRSALTLLTIARGVLAGATSPAHPAES